MKTMVKIGMATVFGGFLLDVLSRNGWTRSEFARSVGMSQPNVSRIINGSDAVAGPPLDRLSDWATALKLEGDERAKFMKLGMLAHAPLEVRAMVAAMEKRIADLEARLGAGHSVGDIELPPPENMLDDFDLPEPAVGAGTGRFIKESDA